MIKIDDLLSLLKKGWVAMDENQEWFWFENKPRTKSSILGGYWQSNGCEIVSNLFDIAPADDWKKSLIRVKGND